jgi:ABC-2 type transport system ATP-binding protein
MHRDTHASRRAGTGSERGRTRTSFDDVEMAAVLVDNLTISYGARTAVNAISWQAHAGQVLAVLGPNGAGKTSTIETLEGYRTPTSGSVKVLGLDPIRDARALAPRIGVMLQRNGVYLTMPPIEVVRLFAAYYEDRALNPDELVERVGLGTVAKTPWRRLSGGEQQRLSLALALVGRPEVVFLDEPTAMIDPAARGVVRDIIRELRSDGACVVLTTHDLDDAERLADNIVIIDSGVVVAQGTPAELTAAQAGDGISFTSGVGLDVGALATFLGAAVTGAGGAFVAAVDPTPTNVARLTGWLAENGQEVGSIRAGRRSLEDVFVKLTETAREVAATPPPRQRKQRAPRGRS